MLPSIFGENWLDDWFSFPSEKDLMPRELYGKHARNIMRTDVRENEESFELDIDLPGFKKEDIQAVVENGYLTVTASKGLDKDEQDKKGNYIRRERYSGSCSRSFYVGDAITESEISAKFEDGILQLTIPKKVEKPEDKRKYITIG